MRSFLSLLLTLCGAATAFGQASIDYQSQVKPLFKERCTACHGALEQEAGLRLDTGALVRQGGDSGPAVVAGSPDESWLIQRVTAEDPAERMPPEGEPLTADQIDVLKRWIIAGALSPDDEQPEPDPREHWAFRVPTRPHVPHADGSQPQSNPVDAFLERELIRHGINPQPAAPKHILLRRVYLDLIGLPPTRDELHAFLADDSPLAYERVVDRLLNDPRHGERWGRHWMDVWRYSDWYGRRDVNDVRNSASQIYRWRDWIVQSLNANKGYDRMLKEMLAADELFPEDYEAGVATGFLIRNFYSLNANDWMRSTVEHTGKAFLGLTFNCAHCHDHKYDPISHDDYFRLRAFFEPMYVRQDRMPGEADPGKFVDYKYGASGPVQRLGAVRVFDKDPAAPTWFYTGGDERNRVTERGSIAPGLPSFLRTASLHIEPVTLPPVASYPGLRPEIRQTMLADAAAAVARAESALAEIRSQQQAPQASLLEQLARSEAAYQQAAASAAAAGSPGALAGEQSLLLNAAAGRAVVLNGVHQLPPLEEGTQIEFRLLIVADAHFNFQLVKDTVNGLTAAFVAFDRGRILSYQPGTTNEFEAGLYDFAAGQRSLHVRLVLSPALDHCLLTVRSTSDDKVLADALPIALNGWNPISSPVTAIAFDARTGSVAAIDDVALSKPSLDSAMQGEPTERLLSFDFEAPLYTVANDIVGIDGWQLSSFAVAPGYSTVSSTVANESLDAPWEQLQAARRAVHVATLPIRAAELGLTAAQAEQVALLARIAADQARYGEAPTEDADALARIASRKEREANLVKAQSQVVSHELALSLAEARATDDPQRAVEMQAATTALASAKNAVLAAQAALADEPLAATYSPLTPIYPQASTGRRRALAEWITSRDNPLTARVAVNHIWLRHFHAPLQATVFDFGRNGAQPTHPDLLDWLAVEFVESGWDLKHIHRLLVTSDAYRRVSTAGDGGNGVALDPENKLLWRMNSSRMEAEVIRDSLLYCAGRLDSTMGGIELENQQSLVTYRRSMYYSIHPEGGGKSSFGELFNAPDPLECYRRTTSIVPQQALALTNSEFVHGLSVDLVRLWNESLKPAGLDGDAETNQFIAAMFEQILSRPPTAEELSVCRQAIVKQQQLAANLSPIEAQTHARASLVRVLMNHNDFVTIR